MVFYGVLLFGYAASWFNKKILFYFFAFILAVLAFFRYGIGIDYFAYQYLFGMLQPSLFYELKYSILEQEVGFRAIGALFKSWGINYQVYLAFFSFVNLLYIVKLCKRYSINPTLALVLFFSFYYVTWLFSAIRQGLVIAVGLYYLLKCIEERKPIKLILISLLLSSIHISALILIFLYVASKFNFKKRSLMILSVISIMFSFLPTGVLISKLSWLPLIGSKLIYIESTTGINSLDFQSIARILLLLMALVFYDYYSKQNEVSKKIINLYIISIIMYFLFQFSELIAARFAIYGKFLDIIILSNVLYHYKERINRLIYIYLIFVLCSLYLYKETNNQINGALFKEYKYPPYVNIFNKEEFEFKNPYRTLNSQ